MTPREALDTLAGIYKRALLSQDDHRDASRALNRLYGDVHETEQREKLELSKYKTALELARKGNELHLANAKKAQEDARHIRRHGLVYAIISGLWDEAKKGESGVDRKIVYDIADRIEAFLDNQ